MNSDLLSQHNNCFKVTCYIPIVVDCFQSYNLQIRTISLYSLNVGHVYAAYSEGIVRESS